MKVPFLDIKKQQNQLAEEIMKTIGDILNSCSFVNGPYVQRFESEVQEYLNVKHAIGCGNGTDALVLALRACGIGYGDEVITTPFSFFATAEAIASVGATPVFVDIKDSDYTIDPDKIEAAISKKTKAILPVQIFGCCCDMDSIMEIARKHSLFVIEDDAQAFGSRYNGKAAGTLADIGCFSFYPTKNLGCCGDGGMCTTNNDELAVAIRALREHGAGKNGAKAAEHLTGKISELSLSEDNAELYDPYKYYNFLIGYNSRLDAIQAGILSVKLRHIDDYNRLRAEIAKKYIRNLSDEFAVPKYSDKCSPCWHQFAIRTGQKEKLCKYLGENGIGAGTFYPVPLHKQKAFSKQNCKNAGEILPVAERVCSETVCLPIYPELTEEEVNCVIRTVNKFLEV